MKKFYFLILGIVLCGMVAQAQNSYEGHIGFGQHHVVRKGGELNVEVSLDLGAVKLAAQQMIVLTPVLRSTEGEERTAISSGSDSRTPSLSGAETIFSFRH